MGRTKSVFLCLFVIALLSAAAVVADEPYRYFTWTVTYGTASPLGVSQQVILINGQFPGPSLDCITNDNIIINVINQLDEPFLLTWNGIKQRKSSWQDGVLGTNCPIPPKANYTYKFQTKDQIGTYTYFPSTAMHRIAGGFGPFNVRQRSVISVPYNLPEGDFSLLIGDWYKANHKLLRQTLDSGKRLPFPDGLLINGISHSSFTGDQGKTYLFRISNLGLSLSFNFRIQGHKMKLVEVEGSHTIQSTYESLDIHVGQSMAVLVTLDQPPKDYYIVATSRFTKTVLTATAVLHYRNSKIEVSGQIPAAPAYNYHWSMLQARTLRYGGGQWIPKYRKRYNLVDALSRHTVQVYPNGWSAILVSLDNQGMWNLRSAMWGRQYLGQQIYIRVWTQEKSYSNEYDIPQNVLLCGKATGLHL